MSDSATIDLVSEYATNGFPIFELKGKKPLKEGVGWQRTPHNPFLYRSDFPGNYGIIIPKEYLVIDVDVKNGAKGKDSYAKLTEKLGMKIGWEQETFVVRTGSGGFHIYLKKSPGLLIRKNLPDYPGIDFLTTNFGKGHYVVGAGCIHPDTGKEYEVIAGSPGGIHPAPDALERLLARPEDIIPTIQPGFVDDDPINIEKFEELLASMPEVPKGNQRNSAYIAACRGRDLGLSQDKTMVVLMGKYNGIKLVPPIREDEVRDTVANAYRYAQGEAGNKNVSAMFQTVDTVAPEEDFVAMYDQTAKGEVQKTLNNAVNYLLTLPTLTGVFKYNTFTGSIELDSSAPWYKQRGSKGPNVADEDMALLKYFLSKAIKVEFSSELLWDAVIVVAHRKHYHPIRNYLTGLVWDRVPRLDNWLTTYGGAVDTIYTRNIARKTLCAAVKRVFEPGCKWDYVLIMEGAQGIGKSTMCRILGRLWGGDMNLDPHAKDSVAMMMGKWIIELSEMATLKWADASALKSFISREKDTVRLAYARHAKDFLRQSIFIGTVNPEHVGYLNDITGNRRFWIIHLPGPINIMDLENDCNQLWAEAMMRYKTEPLYLSGEAEQLQVYEAQARMPEDPMRRHVAKYIEENPEKDIVDILDLLGYVGIPAQRASKADQSRLAQSLIDLGWERSRTMENGVIKHVFKRPFRDKIRRAIDEL